MGQQQLLLIILSVIIVGIAIAVGLSLFSAQSIQSNRDAIINDLNNLAAQAFQYKIRPSCMAGGSGSYGGFSIPSKMVTNDNATYSIGATTAASGAMSLVFTAVSAQKATNTIKATADVNGKLSSWAYAGDFQ